VNDIFLLLLFIAAFAVAWIEWIPERYGIFPKLLLSLLVVTIGLGWIPEWYGWVVLSIGIAELAWIYFSPKRRKEWPNLFSGPTRALRDCALAVARRMPDRKSVGRADSPREKKSFLTAARMRNAVGAVSAVVLSPIAALPTVFVLSVLLVTWDALFGNAPQVAGDLQEAAKQVLGRSFVAVVATADLFARHLLISGPLLFAGGYAIAAYSIGSGVFWQRYSRGLLLFGTIYPTVFVAAVVFGWFDGPFFN
jgi:hypothetical protein